MKRTIAKLTPVAAAVAVAIGSAPVKAQEFLEIDDLINPRSSVTAGMGYTDDDSRWFGEYSGFVDYDEDGFKPIFDLDYVTRDSDTGTWVRANADIGRRAVLGAEYERQGDFGVGFDYQRITRQDPLSYNTGITGRFTETQDPAGRTPRDVTFRTERDDFRLNLNKQFGNGLGGRVMFRQMQRDGARNWGNGFAIGFLSEPIDQTTREFDAAIDYTMEGLALSGGVYGTSFENENDVINSVTTLPQDNESYQFYLNGAFDMLSTTHGNFKLAHTTATQDDNFFQPSDIGGRTNLDAEVETTLVYGGLTSRPMDKLTLSGSLRYEDREDNTPAVQYFVPTGSRVNRTDGNNKPHSRETLNWKLEAGYELPMGFKVIGGFAWDDIERSRPPLSSTLYADNTTENYRIELRRSMDETLNGSLSYTYSDREIDNAQRSGYNQADWIAVFSMSDRERDQYKLLLDWVPSEPLSIQFRYEYADDEYDLGVASYGRQEGSTELVSLDASYQLSEDWTLTGWITRDEQEFKQFTGGDWTSDITYTGNSAGLGLRGLVGWVHTVGAELEYSKDESSYAIDVDDDLPDIEYEYLRFNLYGNYVLDDNSGIRADWIYTKFENDEWAWDGFTYVDGTTVTVPDDEDVNFIGVSFYHRWR
jgi:MtrB/PioB family decaheme-associated outer membrane protein